MSTPNQSEAASRIGDLRTQIDRYDAEILRLVSERAKVSELVQEVRVGAGGARIELGREAAILQHYRKRLGKAGCGLGEAVLRVCRGGPTPAG